MFTGKLKKVDGKLVYTSNSSRTAYEAFVRRLAEGAEVEVYMEEINDDGTLAQLAKVHAMIKDLAAFTGNPFMGMKYEVKRQAGLCFIHQGELVAKSFGDCSIDELGLAIEAAIILGERVGLTLNQYGTHFRRTTQTTAAATAR